MGAEPAFLDRDLAWLAFNRRVLHEAEDERTPLLERVRFLGIVTSNLDEFFMKRVGALARQAAAAVDAAHLRTEVRREVTAMQAAVAACFTDQLRPALAAQGIHLLGWPELDARQRATASDYFQRHVFPVLTPLAVDPGHPFPLVSSLSTSLGVLVGHPDRTEEPLFARVKIPDSLPHWVPVEAAGAQVRFARLVDLVTQHLDRLFPGMRIVATMPFRVTRSTDVERDTDDADDLLEAVADELRERRFAPVVRLEHAPQPDARILRFLVSELDIGADDVYELPAELDYTGLRPVADLPRPRLKYEPWTPAVPTALAGGEAGFFAVIRANDVLVHHPYESFAATVEKFVATAVDDPRVLAIKMTLYRTGDGSPFLGLLQRAAESGKQVVCVVELQARLDEERNIAVARTLEKAGVHVVYGVLGLKTHCKLVLVVREEPDGIRCYTHVATGNYNPRTALLYTDLGLFTARREVAEDVSDLFNYLTGRSLHRRYQRLLVAPVQMKQAFLARIDREADNARSGRPARIVAKLNSLEDGDLCAALCRASQAGVPVNLLVRGFATLRPGVEGVSDRIRIVSVIGRFLEHARVYHFADGSPDPLDGEYFLGSADWMHRNLEARVEVAVPVDDRLLRERLWELLTLQLDDRRHGWDMRSDGTYLQRTPDHPDQELGSQARLMALTRQRTQQ